MKKKLTVMKFSEFKKDAEVFVAKSVKPEDETALYLENIAEIKKQEPVDDDSNVAVWVIEKVSTEQEVENLKLKVAELESVVKSFDLRFKAGVGTPVKNEPANVVVAENSVEETASVDGEKTEVVTEKAAGIIPIVFSEMLTTMQDKLQALKDKVAAGVALDQKDVDSLYTDWRVIDMAQSFACLLKKSSEVSELYTAVQPSIIAIEKKENKDVVVEKEDDETNSETVDDSKFFKNGDLNKRTDVFEIQKQLMKTL